MKRFEFGKNNRDKRNTNNVNNLENSKSKKKISKDIKAKFSNLEIKPQFLIIGLVVIITVISLIYFIFLKYSPIMNFKYEGYAIKGKEITENLLGASKNSEESDTQNDGENNQNIGLAKIEEQGTIFKKLGTYFIGNKEKTEIDLNYPIYINDKNTIYNLSKEIMLISKDFEKVSGYPNISITDGKVYNGNSLERADSKEYIFAKTEEGIYINLKEIKINTTANEYTIPANSLIVFEENEIKYYSLADDILLFNKINDVDYNSQVIIKNIEKNEQNSLSNNAQKVDNQYNYEELLTRLGIIGNAKNDVENAQEEIQKEDTTAKEQEENKEEKEDKKENETTPSENKQEEPQQELEQENNEQGNQENKYIKPEVTAEEFTAEVYSAKSTLTIKDPTARIIEAPTFEIYKDGKIYLRRTYTQAGEIIVTGLDADTEYEIIGKYIYKNEEDKKIENTFFKGTVKTKGYEALGIIELAKEEGEIYNNKIQIKNVKITSDLHNEVIKGIDTVELKTGSIKTVLKNKELNDLIQGKEITIESSEGLKSNEKIEYELKFYDKKGKELKVENNKGKTRTSKQEPKVTIKIKEQDIVSVTLGIKLANKDNVDLENYKYIVRKPNGEIEKEERLSQNQKEIKLDDLDSNQYYNLKIYANYDLNDNKGVQKQVEIGDLVFATQPLSTLGSVELKVEGKDITTDKATLSYEIDEERTDKRLIQILNSIKVELINKNTGKVVKTTEIQDEELQTLKAGQKLEKTYENLVSNTTYEIKITSKVKPGTKEESAPVTYNYQSFTTVKAPAKVEIQNKFVTKDLIDLDVRIEDKDNAILNNKVRMELRDEKNTLVETSEVKTNKDWLRKTYNKLEENKTYTLKFYADEYNEGHTDATYKRNYLLKEIDILTEEGITGKIDLKSMLKKTTGKNLVDPDSKIKWYTPFVGTGGYYDKSYDKETNTVMLGVGTINSNQSYVYDLREYIGKEITISFKIKKDEGIRAYIQNSKIRGQKLEEIKNIEKDSYKEYKKTLVVNDTGYVGFWVSMNATNKDGKAYIKDLQIELGNTKTNYEEYKYNVESKVLVNLEDKRDEIITNDYYIKIYEDGKLIDTKKYEDFPESNKLENVEKELNIKEGHDYKLELAVKIRLRDYVISIFEFNTKNGEILGISTVEEYKEIQPEGNYIVLNDLDFRNPSTPLGFKTSAGIKFQGSINFNGKNILKKVANGGGDNTLFGLIGEKGILENIVLKLYFINTLPSNMYGLFSANYGTISNIYVSVEKSIKKDNVFITLLGSSNYGTITNFVINYKEQIYSKHAARIIEANKGTIENGYIYGENIKILRPESTNASGILAVHNAQGTIRNIYSLVNYESENNFDNKPVSLVVNNNDKGTVENIYTVGIGNIYNKTYSPNTYAGYGKVENSYYINDIEFIGKTDKKITNKALWDKSFQNNILNSSNNWEVDELIEMGYYPWIKLNDCMPRQDYIALPEMTDADLPEILFAETLENTNNTAKVKISMYNPSGEEVKEIKVKNIDCTIESQEYANGKSEVIVNLSNPIQYLSTYSILSFTTKGAFNLEYTKEYKEGEVLINIDLYNEIYTIEDWYEIKKKNSENFKLMTNLDFKNADPKQYAGIQFYGILDGTGHTIQNMYITKSSGYPLFTTTNRRTVLRDLNIKNYNAELSYNAGIIQKADRITIENLNIDGVNIKHNGNDTYVGGFIAEARGGSIENVTYKNLNIESYGNANVLYIGGLIGNGQININNVYMNNINIQAKCDSKDTKIGGLIGYCENAIDKIRNVLVSGNITTNLDNVGGISGHGMVNMENAIANVNIIADSSYVGGLIGKTTDSSLVLYNNIYIGDIVNKKQTEYISAICGTEKNGENNYIYSKNKINGRKVEGYRNVLTKEKLEDINTYIKILNWDDNYNYSDLNNKLPLLKNKEKNNILPNQEPIYIENKELDIKSVDTLREDSNSLKIRVEITNPHNLEITKLEIENMNVQVLEKRNNNGITYIDLIGVPTKYYDNYQIKEIMYLKDGEEIKEKAYYLIEEIFYKEITKYEDWQNIDKESGENYRLLTDLDFNGKNNINYNLKIGRLITEGNMHTIKNLNLNVGNSNNFGLISTLNTKMENINFENIKIINNTTVNFRDSIGIIGINSGIIRNVNFTNVEIIDNGNNLQNVGMIGRSYLGELSNVQLNDININAGKENVGGLLGKSLNTKISDITADNININAKKNYVGGISGVIAAEFVEYQILRDITISNSTIAGNSYVGGASGKGLNKGNNIYINNCDVTGISHVGGAVGDQSWNLIENGVKVENSKIQGKKYIGGIAGNGTGTNQNSVVINCLIEGNYTDSMYVGGIAGYTNNTLNSTINNSQIISKGMYVGGITGDNEQLNYCYAINSYIEGYSYVGGISGHMDAGNMGNNYTNSEVVATEHSAGGILGYLDNSKMDNLTNVTTITRSYYANGTIQSKEYVGGIVGEMAKEIYDADGVKRYYSNYTEGNLISENTNTISLGVGNMPKENTKFIDNYYYKFSKVNGNYPTAENEKYIPIASYLVEQDLKQEDTYKNKLKWANYYDYEILSKNKYPILKSGNILQMQDGINIPEDPILEATEGEETPEDKETETIKTERPEYTINYNGKTIKTYETYSEIIAEDGSKVIREGVRLYVKNGKLYALPIMMDFGDSEIKLVENNFIIDSYNGKEYETVLGSDGRLYDLKETINYPENFVNKEIVSIGNNLDSEDFVENLTSNNMNIVDLSKNEKEEAYELEITYKNGDTIKFNYQTGEIIEENKKAEKAEDSKELFKYIKEQFAEIGEKTTQDKINIEMKNKYDETLKLENKLAETPVEEAIQLQNSNVNKPEDSTGTDNIENEETNNSLKEQKYISIYNAEKDDYQIYQEEELLDTSKQEVISENEKIEANNLNKYYASEVEAKNTKMGIVWIALSIIGVLIILIGIWGRT